MKKLIFALIFIVSIFLLNTSTYAQVRHNKGYRPSAKKSKKKAKRLGCHKIKQVNTKHGKSRIKCYQPKRISFKKGKKKSGGSLVGFKGKGKKQTEKQRMKEIQKLIKEKKGAKKAETEAAENTNDLDSNEELPIIDDAK